MTRSDLKSTITSFAVAFAISFTPIVVLATLDPACQSDQINFSSTVFMAALIAATLSALACCFIQALRNHGSASGTEAKRSSASPASKTISFSFSELTPQ